MSCTSLVDIIYCARTTGASGHVSAVQRSESLTVSGQTVSVTAKVTTFCHELHTFPSLFAHLINAVP